MLSCAAGIASIAPEDLAPAVSGLARAWQAQFVPDGYRRYELRWRFFTPKGSTAGRAVVRIAPPDSLRFDYRGPFGRSGAALLLGDSLVWAEPEKDVRELIPMAPLFWAALGIPLAPSESSTILTRQDANQRAWRVIASTDTLDLVHFPHGPARLLAQLRREGIAATTEVRFGAIGVPTQGKMRFPRDGAAFIFTVERVDSTAVFDAATWRRP